MSAKQSSSFSQISTWRIGSWCLKPPLPWLTKPLPPQNCAVFAQKYQRAASTVSGPGSGSLKIGLDSFFPDDPIDHHPTVVKIFIKPGVTAGELITLVTKINPHFLVTGPYTAVFETRHCSFRQPWQCSAAK